MKLEYLKVGEIVNTHGVRGEMKLLPWTDGPEFLLDFRRVFIDGKEYALESCRIQKTCNLLKLRGVDTVEDAQLLRGKTVEVYRQEAPDGLIFADELLGMEVYAADTMIGKIVDVLDMPSSSVYVIRGEKEYMIPAVREFILSTDLESNVMQVRLLEGMETDAP
jgi:16S rRNA processing protein RimM